MPGRRRPPTVEEERRALVEALADPRSDGARERLRAALQSARSLVVAKAAQLVRQHRVEGLDAELAAAFERFLVDAVKRDPSCNAKLAAIEALDFGESPDATPFLRAVRHVQREPAWGPPVDTAAPLRARGVLALARLGHADFALVAATLLADAEPPVRQAAADALAHRGDPAGAALVLLKLKSGDEDPMVTLAAMNALVALAPAWGLDELAPRLAGDDPQARELAAVALGQSRRDEALGLLVDALERGVRAEEREPLLRGLGLHRSERALAVLLAWIEDGREADARAAVRALGVRRFEPGVAARVRAAAQANAAAALDDAVDEAFPADD